MKVSVVGTGNVGSALLFHLVDLSGIEEILVINLEDTWSLASIMDVASAKPDKALKLSVAHFDQLRHADIIVLTSGVQMEVGETGEDVLDRNIEVMNSILSASTLKDSVIVIALATPVDDITAFIQKKTALPYNQVMGFGGDLDRNRLAYTLKKSGIKTQRLNIIGEHGGYTIPAYDGEQQYPEVTDRVRHFLSHITAQGGRPRNMATGPLLADLVGSILSDAGRRHFVSGWHSAYELYLTWPFVIGRRGVLEAQSIEIPAQAQKNLDALVARKKAKAGS